MTALPVRARVNCPACGRRMSRFLNPERYICSYPEYHGAATYTGPVGNRHLNTGRTPGGGARRR